MEQLFAIFDIRITFHVHFFGPPIFPYPPEENEPNGCSAMPSISIRRRIQESNFKYKSGMDINTV